jgi:hypothetical protein
LARLRVFVSNGNYYKLVVLFWRNGDWEVSRLIAVVKAAFATFGFLSVKQAVHPVWFFDEFPLGRINDYGCFRINASHFRPFANPMLPKRQRVRLSVQNCVEMPACKKWIHMNFGLTAAFII